MPSTPQSTYPQYDVRKIIACLRNPKDDLVNIFCHRGIRLQLGSTENSYLSTANAARDGWEGIELDLRMTKDGQVLLFHDDGLGRGTDIAPAEGEEVRNPFTGLGYNPLVEETNWFGVIEHLYLKNNLGAVTSVPGNNMQPRARLKTLDQSTPYV
jgi:glycerophosphoryl diester phosphodiesterase